MANEITTTIIGNLTADPELRHTNNNTAVAGFTIATTPRIYNRTTNQWEDGQTLFMRCTAWQQLAENITTYLRKGQRVIATGRLQQRSWEKDGQTHTSIELQVDEIGVSLRFTQTPPPNMNNATQNGQTPATPITPTQSSFGGNPWALGGTPPF